MKVVVVIISGNSILSGLFQFSKIRFGVSFPGRAAEESCFVGLRFSNGL